MYIISIKIFFYYFSNIFYYLIIIIDISTFRGNSVLVIVCQSKMKGLTDLNGEIRVLSAHNFL